MTSVALVAAVLAALAVLAAARGVAVASHSSARSRLGSEIGPEALRPRRARLVVPDPVGRALTRAGVSSDHATLMIAWLGSVGVCAVAIPFISGAVVAVAAIAVGPPIAVVAAQGRGARIRRQHLPGFLDGVASGLRSGRSLQLALGDAADSAGPLRAELLDINRSVTVGRPLVEALDEWSNTDPETRLAAAALSTAAAVGGPGAQALSAAASSLRERADADAAIDALSVQARLSAVMLTAAPVAFAFLLTVLDPDSADFLLRTRIGWLCIAVGAVLDGLGAWWMSTLVRKAR